MKRQLFLSSILVHIFVAAPLLAQKTVTFPLIGKSKQQTQAQVQGDLYGQGTRAVILAHGGRFHKESWKPQAEALAKAGFLVLAVGFRGDNANPDGSPGTFGTYPEHAADILAAIPYLRGLGAKSISAVGGSLGGDAIGDADAASTPGTFDRIVILASEGGSSPEKLTGRKLFILARDDSSGDGLRLPGISRNFARTPEPKKLVLLEGSAHAQFLFNTDQGPRLLVEIVSFLSAP